MISLLKSRKNIWKLTFWSTLQSWLTWKCWSTPWVCTCDHSILHKTVFHLANFQLVFWHPLVYQIFPVFYRVIRDLLCQKLSLSQGLLRRSNCCCQVLLILLTGDVVLLLQYSVYVPPVMCILRENVCI